MNSVEMNYVEMKNLLRATQEELAALNKREKEEQGTCSWGFWDDMESREKERDIAYYTKCLQEMEPVEPPTKMAKVSVSVAAV
jgi:hypothetical protein